MEEAELPPLLASLQRVLAGRTLQVPKVEPGRRRAAGVLVPFFNRDERLQVLFIRRTDRVPTHKRQVAFPGGAAEPEDDSLLDTALREASEEVGIEPTAVTVLGPLQAFDTRVSDFVISPFCGYLPGPDPAFRPTDFEVEEVLEVPLDQLRDPETRHWGLVPGFNLPIPLTYYKVGEAIIWGASGESWQSCWTRSMKPRQPRLPERRALVPLLEGGAAGGLGPRELERAGIEMVAVDVLELACGPALSWSMRPGAAPLPRHRAGDPGGRPGQPVRDRSPGWRGRGLPRLRDGRGGRPPIAVGRRREGRGGDRGGARAVGRGGGAEPSAQLSHAARSSATGRRPRSAGPPGELVVSPLLQDLAARGALLGGRGMGPAGRRPRRGGAVLGAACRRLRLRRLRPGLGLATSSTSGATVSSRPRCCSAATTWCGSGSLVERRPPRPSSEPGAPAPSPPTP